MSHADYARNRGEEMRCCKCGVRGEGDVCGECDMNAEIQPNCICRSGDARECLRLRYPNFYRDDDNPTGTPMGDERCECACHHEDDDTLDLFDWHNEHTGHDPC